MLESLTNGCWQLISIKIKEHLDFNSKIWFDSITSNIYNYREFKQAFLNKYWSQHEQNNVLCKILGPGDFKNNRDNVINYILKLFNQARY